MERLWVTLADSQGTRWFAAQRKLSTVNEARQATGTPGWTIGSRRHRHPLGRNRGRLRRGFLRAPAVNRRLNPRLAAGGREPLPRAEIDLPNLRNPRLLIGVAGIARMRVGHQN